MDTGLDLLESALKSVNTGTTVISKYRGVPVEFSIGTLGMTIEATIGSKYNAVWTFFPTSTTKLQHAYDFVQHLMKAMDDRWLKDMKDMGQI